MFFSYDFEDGIEFHDTEEEAKRRAEMALDSSRDHACESGWTEQEHEICWGKVSEVAVVVSEEVAPKESEFDELIDYQLRDPSNDQVQPEKTRK